MEIYGTFAFGENTYPFVLDDRIVRIIGKPLQYTKDFLDIDEVERIDGVTSSNRDICFLRCKFIKSYFGTCTSFSIQGYALSSNNVGIPCDFTYDKSVFSSDAIDTFFSPQKAVKIDMDINNWDGTIDIHVSPFDKTKIAFSYLYSQCQINVARYIRIQKHPTSIGEVNTLFSFEYQESQPLERIIDDYLALYDFLSFVNYNANIGFKEIHICKRGDQKALRETAKIHLFTNKSEYENTSRDCITIDDIPTEKLGDIFTRVASLRNNDMRLRYYFPDNKSEARFVDPGKWLIMALNFEGLFATTFPDYKSRGNASFRRAKDLILKRIDNETDCECLSKKETEYYGKCREQVERYEGQLEEKFNYAIRTNAEALEKILEYNEKTHNIKKRYNYGNNYATYRNKIAHGSIEPLTSNEIATYRIIQSLIYILLLSNLDLKASDIAKIIEKLFL